MGIRLLVIDDNPHVRWHGRVYPVNATFHRFLAAFLDLPGAPVASIAHAVPLRELADDAPEPATLPVDEQITTVATEPFDGIAGYLRRLPHMLGANREVFGNALREADLVWLKVPASNAILAAALAISRGVPRFVWVAGSARAVAAARFAGARRVVAMIGGAGYDAIGGLVGLGAARVIVGERLIDGSGVVASLLEAHEIHTGDDSPRRPRGEMHVAWAGRVARGKGLEQLLDALALTPRTVELTVVGDGPARTTLAARARTLGVDDRVTWHGYIADRATYMTLLRQADLFAFPSPAEGFPKVVLDAMAAGLPVVARPVGGLRELIAADLLEPADDDAAMLAALIMRLAADPARAEHLRGAASDFAARHTRPAEAARVAETWRKEFVHLPWTE